VPTSKAGLGKGLGSLIPEDFDTSMLVESGERIQKIAVGSLTPNPEQPRTTFDTVALSELASSIKQYGIVQPLVVSPYEGGYIIIAGERRWRASKLAGLKNVPAIVRTSKELERLELALVENVQRVDLSALEQAVSIERLHQQFNLAYNEIAQRLGKANSTVNNVVRCETSTGRPCDNRGPCTSNFGAQRYTRATSRATIADSKAWLVCASGRKFRHIHKRWL